MSPDRTGKVIAAIDNSAASRPVLAMALALAPVLGATVEAVHVREDGGSTARATADGLGVAFSAVDGDPLERIASLAAADDVAAVVVGARGHPGGRRPAGHLALALADHLDKPLLVVPPDADPPERVRRVLVAMEGTRAKTRTLKRAMDLVAGAGVDLVVVHVDDDDSIPSFSDQVQHEADAYAREFVACHCPGASVAELLLHVGIPADEILAAADSTAPELLAVGWPQTDDPGRGAVSRAILDRSRLPVLLVPIA